MKWSIVFMWYHYENGMRMWEVEGFKSEADAEGAARDIDSNIPKEYGHLHYRIIKK